MLLFVLDIYFIEYFLVPGFQEVPFRELLEWMRFWVNYAKSHHCIISEALNKYGDTHVINSKALSFNSETPTCSTVSKISPFLGRYVKAKGDLPTVIAQHQKRPFLCNDFFLNWNSSYICDQDSVMHTVPFAMTYG